MRTLSFTVTQAQAGHALGSLLQTQLGISDSLLARLKRREQRRRILRQRFWF